jgi:hypothetical protein
MKTIISPIVLLDEDKYILLIEVEGKGNLLVSFYHKGTEGTKASQSIKNQNLKAIVSIFLLLSSYSVAVSSLISPQRHRGHKGFAKYKTNLNPIAF